MERRIVDEERKALEKKVAEMKSEEQKLLFEEQGPRPRPTPFAGKNTVVSHTLWRIRHFARSILRGLRSDMIIV